MMDFLVKLNPIGNAVILILSCFPLAAQVGILMKPKEQRAVSKYHLVTSIALVIIGFLIIYFRS